MIGTQNASNTYFDDNGGSSRLRSFFRPIQGHHRNHDNRIGHWVHYCCYWMLGQVIFDAHLFHLPWVLLNAVVCAHNGLDSTRLFFFRFSIDLGLFHLHFKNHRFDCWLCSILVPSSTNDTDVSTQINIFSSLVAAAQRASMEFRAPLCTPTHASTCSVAYALYAMRFSRLFSVATMLFSSEKSLTIPQFESFHGHVRSLPGRHVSCLMRLLFSNQWLTQSTPPTSNSIFLPPLLPIPIPSSSVRLLNSLFRGRLFSSFFVFVRLISTRLLVLLLSVLFRSLLY